MLPVRPILLFSVGGAKSKMLFHSPGPLNLQVFGHYPQVKHEQMPRQTFLGHGKGNKKQERGL